MAGRDLFAAEPTEQPGAGRDLFGGSPVVAQPVAPVDQGPDYGAKMADLMDRYKKGYGLEIRQMNLIESIAKQKGLNISYGMDRAEKTAGSFFEPLAAVASGLVAEPVAGLAGIAQSLNPFADEGAGAEAVESVRDWMTYVPADEKAQELLTETGEMIAPAAEQYDATKSKMADYTFELTGSAAAAAAVYAAPEALLAILGIRRLRGMKTGTVLKDSAGKPTKALRQGLGDIDYGNLPPAVQETIPARVTENFFPMVSESKKSQVFKNVFAEQLRQGGTEGVLADYEIDDYSRIGTSEVGVGAIKQGFERPDVQAMKQFNPETKIEAKKMTNTARQIRNNTRVAMDKRPSDVAGDAGLEKIDFIRNEMKIAGQELDDIAENKLKDEPIDESRIMQAFEDNLKDYNVGFLQAEDGTVSLDFKGSDFEYDSNESTRNQFNTVLKMLSDNQGADAYRVHRLKRIMDSLLDTAGVDKGGLSGAGKRFLQDMRKSFNETVRDVNDDYRVVNEKLHKGITTIENLDKSVGALDITGASANQGLGTQFRKLMSNYNSRIALSDSLDEIDATVGDFGGEFPVNLKDLALMSNILDTRFELVPRESIGGKMVQAGKIADQAARGDKVGIFSKVIGGTANKMRGINDQNAFESLEALLSEGTTP